MSLGVEVSLFVLSPEIEAETKLRSAMGEAQKDLLLLMI
jgi:hypothetical protein